MLGRLVDIKKWCEQTHIDIESGSSRVFAVSVRAFACFLALLFYKLHFLASVAIAKSESGQMQWIEEKLCKF